MENFTAEWDSSKFKPLNIRWNRYDDNTDNIWVDALNVDGLRPEDMKQSFSSYGHPNLENADIIFIASFHDSESTMAQLHTLVYLSESLPRSLTIMLPFFPTGTMERTELGKEGNVPTAHTLAVLLNGACEGFARIRLMVYNLYTLQNRLYFNGGHIQATLHTAIPLIVKRIKCFINIKGKRGIKIDCIVFPDDGAQKKFWNILS